jgi:bifunctional NMN adenylyltransferase/nudix hydrolase
MAAPDDSFDLAICSGRFLLPDEANLALIRAALDRAPRCLVVLRRSFMAATPANPFRWDERAAMLRDALDEDDRDRVRIEPVRERWDESLLLRDVRALAATHGPKRVLWLHAGEPPLDLEEPPAGWSLAASGGEDGDAVATKALHALYEADDAAAQLRTMLPRLAPSSANFLRGWIREERFATVRDDWRQIAKEHRQWSVAPYPVVLSTVDALVRARDRVLLIQRGRSPGKGLWAIPGGFLEPTEGVLHAALRELEEETRLPLTKQQKKQALRASAIFDHPHRSQRGRIITHGFYFDLGDVAPPSVEGADDAADAKWVPISQLPKLEDQFHDDHFHILNTFLGGLME